MRQGLFMRRTPNQFMVLLDGFRDFFRQGRGEKVADAALQRQLHRGFSIHIQTFQNLAAQAEVESLAGINASAGKEITLRRCSRSLQHRRQQRPRRRVAEAAAVSLF
jgi:hypothetical protein